MSNRIPQEPIVDTSDKRVDALQARVAQLEKALMQLSTLFRQKFVGNDPSTNYVTYLQNGSTQSGWFSLFQNHTITTINNSVDTFGFVNGLTIKNTSTNAISTYAPELIRLIDSPGTSFTAILPGSINLQDTAGTILLSSTVISTSAGVVWVGPALQLSLPVLFIQAPEFTPTSATATAGGGVLPAAPTGFVNILIGGVAKRIPYYEP